VGQSIPEFTDEGLLPPGDYEVTFEELRESVLVEGPGPESVWGEEWDREWREHLTRQAETMCNQLWEVGIEDIYLDGSFTEAKAHPNDIDGYFECDARRVATGELQRKLNQIDPKKCWTWDPKHPHSICAGSYFLEAGHKQHQISPRFGSGLRAHQGMLRAEARG
jgi:hypothetical protein